MIWGQMLLDDVKMICGRPGELGRFFIAPDILEAKER